MAQKIAIREHGKDDDYGVIKKEISVLRSPNFETPTKCIKNLENPLPTTAQINEVTKRVSLRTIESFRSGYEQPKDLRLRCIPNKLNLTIFDLMFDEAPSHEITKSLSSYWYASSENTLFVPTVRSKMLKVDKAHPWSELRILQCVAFLRDLINVTEMRNFKAFIGTIPLLPSKFAKPFVDLYLEKEFNAYAIDVGNRDLLNHIGDLRSILYEINERIPLNEVFIYACNLGIPKFEAHMSRADDFLSLFAYIDAFGNTFKTKGGGDAETKPKPPQAKKFLKEDLVYRLLPDDPLKYGSFNQREQVKEADAVRSLVGVEKMQKYLDTKKGVDPDAIKHLGAMMERIKIK